MTDDFKSEWDRHHPLMQAIRNQNEDKVQRLVEKGAEVNRNVCGIPLGEALDVGNERITKILLEAGADPKPELQTLPWETAALERVALKDRTALIDLFLSYASRGEERIEQKILNMTLRGALGGMHLDTIQLLFRNGAVIDPTHLVDRSDPQHLWIHEAAGWDGSEEVLIDLLARNVYPINAQRGDGQTALHLACVVGHGRAVQVLLQNGANSNVQDALGQTPLHKVSMWHCLDDMKCMLLEYGADQSLRDKGGRTPAEIAMALDSKSESPSTGSKENSEQQLKMIHEDSKDSRTFNEVVRRLSLGDLAAEPSTSRPPTRLIDIHTGKIVLGSEDKKYVILSYIWSPEKYRRGHPRYLVGSHQVLVPGYFDEAADWLVDKNHGIVEKVDSVDERLPLPTLNSSQADTAYYEEVYTLAATEAARRGLRYVWMDGLCIDQTSPSDKEAEIPFMADYYRNAVCCVVVSELLRQKLVIGWGDMQHIGTRPEGPKKRIQSWVLPDETLFAWIIGFHHHRVWTFQETFLAREVVVCGSGLRLHASNVVRSRMKEHEANRNQGNERFSVLKEHFPLHDAGAIAGATSLSLSHCLHLLKDRSCYLEDDRVYGVLGLFPPTIRSTVPVNYSISMGAALANYMFASICAGELVNLFMLRDADSEPHEISNAPSWLPTGYGSPFESVVDMTRHANLRFSAQPSARTLSLFMPYLAISDVQLRSKEFSKSIHWGHHNTVVRPRDEDGRALPFVAAVGVEPLGQWNRNFESWMTGTDRDEKRSIQEAAMLRENETRRSRIWVAAKENRAAMASIGVRKLTNAYSSRPDMWLWLILCTEDGGVSWRREAIGITGKLDCELKWREFSIR